MDHKYYKYVGYENYNLKGVALDQAYLSWNKTNDSKIKNPNFSWGMLFNAPDYLTFPADINGNVFPQFYTLTRRNKRLFRENRNNRYRQFISKHNPDKSKTGYVLLNELKGLHSVAKEQIDYQIQNLEQVDNKLIDVLKVFYFECEKLIKTRYDKGETKDESEFVDLINAVSWLYKSGIRHVCDTEILLEHWIPKRINKPYVTEPIGRSLETGISVLVPKKEKILDALQPIYEKYIHIESLKYFVLNDMPVLESQFPDIDIKIKSAKNIADKRMYEAEKANLPIRNEVIHLAENKLKDENLTIENYLTKGGNINSKMYNYIRNKTGQNRSNINRWLKEHYGNKKK